MKLKTKVKSLNEQFDYNHLIRQIELNELIDLLKDLIKIPSINPPGQEEEIANFIASEMDKIGMAVEIDEIYPNRPNVYGLLNGSEGKPTLIFNGHMDVVPVGENWNFDPFDPQLIDEKMYGLGAADMKGGLAAMLIAAKAIQKSGITLKGNLMITAVVDEEFTGRGTKEFVERKIKNKNMCFAVVGEPTNLDICIAHKGDVNYEVRTIGKSAHSSVPEHGINAINKMVPFLLEIEKLSDELRSRHHKLLGSPKISVTTIKGGNANMWTIPDNCSITVDRRLIPGETGETAEKELVSIVNKIKESDSEIQVEFKMLNSIDPMEISEQEVIVQTIKRVADQITCRSCQISGFTATCDAGILVNQARIPTVIFGPGDISQAHKPDEYIRIADALLAAKVYALTAVNLLR